MQNEQKLSELLHSINSGKDVSRRRLHRAIGSVALAAMERAWRKEVQTRNEKPAEIVEYARRLGIALRKHGKADHHSARGSVKAGRLFEAAEADFENALEYLREVLQGQPDLRFWIDRDISFNEVGFGYHPEGMPYPIWSKSPYARKGVMPKRTIRDFKREALEEAMERMEMRQKRRPDPLPDLGMVMPPRGSKNLQSCDLSAWKF